MKKDYKLNIKRLFFNEDIKKYEKKILKIWKNNYKFLTGKKKFIIHDGPPYANGNIHIGHCINKIFKDLIIKSKIFMNYKVLYILGWDCHGLPIEINFKGKKKILEKCRKYAENQVKEQKKGFDKLGVFYDPNIFYKTMDFNLEYKEIKILYRFFEKGYIKKKKSEINWCSECKSTISNFEFCKIKRFSFNFLCYLKLRYKSKFLLKKIKINFFKKILFIRKIIISKKYFDNSLHFESINIEFGDNEKVSFSNKSVINFSFLSIYFRRNFIIKIKKKERNFKICWRHKCDIKKKIKEQFFINIKKKKIIKSLKEILKNVEYYPKSSKKNVIKNIIKRPNWTISRQKKWGVPISVFEKKNKPIFNKKTKKIYLHFLKNVRKIGIKEWSKKKYSKKAEEMGLKKNKDILDVWFDSGVTHYTVLKNKKFNLFFPADIYLEGNDQHRGWFNSSMITSYLINKKSPYKKLITHGFALDKYGKKMSKSLGNVISPDYIINKYNTDILRLYISSRNLYKDIKISIEELNLSREIYLKIRNLIRFINNNIYDFKKKLKKNLLYIDICVINYKNKVENKITNFYKKFLFHKAFKFLENFCFDFLSNFYFEIIKDRLYTYASKSKERFSAQYTLKKILKFLLVNFSIFIPFFSEINYLKFFSKKSVFFERIKKRKISNKKIQNLNELIRIKKKINKNFSKFQKIINLPKTSVSLLFKKNKYKFYRKLFLELKYFLFVYRIKISEGNCEIIKFKVKKNLKKCLRCWNFYKKLKKKEICKKCIKIILGKKIKERKYL